MQLNIIILIALLASTVWSVMTRSLLRSAIGLALTSAILTVLMFSLNSPVAAVFELSVCAGLISVLFVSTISLMESLTMKEVMERMKERLHRFWSLPFIIICAGIMLSLLTLKFNLPLPVPEAQKDVRFILWHTRQLDIFAQVVMLLAGVFGVVILFGDRRRQDRHG